MWAPAPQVQAQSFTMDGQALYADCQKGDQDGRDTLIPFGKCMGYIMGVVDAMEVNRAVDQKPSCIPDGANRGTIRDVIHNYLRDNPAKRTLPAAIVVPMALAAAFPQCGR
jgi:hypothetical protein